MARSLRQPLYVILYVLLLGTMTACYYPYSHRHSHHKHQDHEHGGRYEQVERKSKLHDVTLTTPRTPRCPLSKMPCSWR